MNLIQIKGLAFKIFSLNLATSMYSKLGLRSFHSTRVIKGSFSRATTRPGINNFALPNKGKIVANRSVSTSTSTATINTLETIGTSMPELAALVAVVISVFVIITPLARNQIADLATDSPVMQRYVEKPQDFPTTERRLPMNEYMPDQSSFIRNFFENILPELSDKLETLLEL